MSYFGVVVRGSYLMIVICLESGGGIGSTHPVSGLTALSCYDYIQQIFRGTIITQKPYMQNLHSHV